MVFCPTLHAIDFFIYSRATSGSDDHDAALDEEHWSYIDEFADRLIARGPTLAADRETWTGSVHILNLPGARAAHEFVELEPYSRARLFEEHLIRRFENLLGRTMWDYGGESDDPRFMVIAQLAEGGENASAQTHADLAPLAREQLIVYGELLTPEDGIPVGVCMALQAPTREAVEAILESGDVGLDERLDVQILDWEFGGRR